MLARPLNFSHSAEPHRTDMSSLVKVREQYDEALKDVLSSYGYKVYGEYAERIRHRLGSKKNIKKLVWNWLPVELGKKVLVSNEGIQVVGLSRKDAYEVLEIGI